MEKTIEILKRRRGWFLIPFLVVLLVSLAYIWTFMKSYEADSLIWFDSGANIVSLLYQQSVSQAGATLPIQDQADKLQQLLQSRVFVTKTIKGTPLASRMGDPDQREKTIAYVQNNMKTKVVGPNSLRVTFYGSSPEQAVVVVKSATNSFLGWVKQGMTQQNSQAVSYFSNQAAQYATQLDAAQSQLRAFRSEHPEVAQLDAANPPARLNVSAQVQSDYQTLKAQLEVAQTLYDTSLSDLAKIRVAGAAQQGEQVAGLRVIDQPVRPTGFSKSRLLLACFVALLAALCVGALSVAVAEMSDITLRDEKDVQESLALPLIARVPKQRFKEKNA